MNLRQRERVVAKLLRVIDYLDANTSGSVEYRSLSITVGEERSTRVAIDLHHSWFESTGRGREPRLKGRTWPADGRSVAAAIERLEVPRARRRRR